MKKLNYNSKDVIITYSGHGSLELIRKAKTSKGVFYGKFPHSETWLLIENVKKYEEHEFKTLEELKEYIMEKYN